MLSGEGNAGERWKTTIGLISKKATLHVQHTLLYISLPLFCTTRAARLQRETSRNFFGGNVLVHFFDCRSFSPCIWLVAASISHFVTATTRFSCCSSNIKCLLCFFISRSRSLSPFFSLSFPGLLPSFSFSLSFSCSIFQICGHDN